jgi:hypothetical protein
MKRLEYIHEQHFAEQKNEGRKPDKNSSPRRLKSGRWNKYERVKYPV